MANKAKASVDLYEKFKSNGITTAEKPKEIAKLELILKNYGLETDDSKALFQASEYLYKKAVYDNKEKEYIAKIKDLEIKDQASAQRDKQYSNLSGRGKLAAMAKDEHDRQLELLQLEVNYKDDLMNSGLEKETNPYAAAGRAQGWTGSAAVGYLVEQDIKAQNEAIKLRNEARLQENIDFVINNNYLFSYGYNSDREKYLKDLIPRIPALLMDESSDKNEVFSKISVDNVEYEIDDAGYVKVTADLTLIENYMIYEDVPANIDGSFKVEVYQNGQVIGRNYKSLPLEGLYDSYKLYCTVLCKPDVTKECKIKILPNNLWGIEAYSKGEKSRKITTPEGNKTINSHNIEKDVYIFANKYASLGNLDNLKKAKALFEAIPGYQDSDDRVKQIEKEILEINYCEGIIRAQNQDYYTAIKRMNSLGDYKNANELVEKYEKIDSENKILQQQKKKKGIKTGIMIGIIVVVLTVALVVMSTIKNSKNYDSAISLMNNARYEESIELLEKMSDYKDSRELLNECKYLYAQQLFEKKDYDKAISILQELNGYKDSEARIIENQYQKAIELYKNARNYDANKLLSQIPADYKDVTYYILLTDYEMEKIGSKKIELLGNIKTYGDITENDQIRNEIKSNIDEMYRQLAVELVYSYYSSNYIEMMEEGLKPSLLNDSQIRKIIIGKWIKPETEVSNASYHTFYTNGAYDAQFPGHVSHLKYYVSNNMLISNDKGYTTEYIVYKIDDNTLILKSYSVMLLKRVEQ